MANLTFAEYISTTLAYANEKRDNPSTNRKFRIDDVKKAINCGRHRMLRRVGVGLYRNQDTMDATTGDLTPPVDFFNEGIVLFTPTGGTARALVNKIARDMDIDNPSWRDHAAGTPSTIVWDYKTTGLVARLYPQPSSTVTDGLVWNYSAKLDDLDADADTCPIMNLFPEFQYTLLQAGALYQLYMLEGGEGDQQIAKWKSVFEAECEELQSMMKRIFVANRQQVGR